MMKKTLTLALAAASITAICPPAIADIRIEAVGLTPTRLVHSPDQQNLKVADFYQYKVFAHFSLLTLGDIPLPEKPSAPLLTLSAPGKQPKPVIPAKPINRKAWNRLTIDTGNGQSPLDVFQSSSRRQASTGTILSSCPTPLISNWSQSPVTPAVSINSNTRNPSGLLVLCVDFVPSPPRPTGSISLNGNAPRTGDKIPMAWNIQR